MRTFGTFLVILTGNILHISAEPDSPIFHQETSQRLPSTVDVESPGGDSRSGDKGFFGELQPMEWLKNLSFPEWPKPHHGTVKRLNEGQESASQPVKNPLALPEIFSFGLGDSNTSNKTNETPKKDKKGLFDFFFKPAIEIDESSKSDIEGSGDERVVEDGSHSNHSVTTSSITANEHGLPLPLHPPTAETIDEPNTSISQLHEDAISSTADHYSIPGSSSIGQNDTQDVFLQKEAKDAMTRLTITNLVVQKYINELRNSSSNEYEEKMRKLHELSNKFAKINREMATAISLADDEERKTLTETWIRKVNIQQILLFDLIKTRSATE